MEADPLRDPWSKYECFLMSGWREIYPLKETLTENFDVNSTNAMKVTNEWTNIWMDKRKDESYIPLSTNAGAITTHNPFFYWQFLVHHHHIHFRALFSSTEGWAFCQVFLEGVLSTQNDFEGQQNPYLASFCHSQALHPMISLACQIFSVQPHSACVLLQSSLCCALHVQTISSYWCGAPHLSPGCQALW